MDSPTQLAMIAARWQGSFHNRRQVAANLARGGPAAPELTRELRTLVVERLPAPQLGEVVLYFQEFRASAPHLAHRQRVVVLRQDQERGAVRAEQLFFRGGPTYDRPPLAASLVADLGPEAFDRHPGCDLFFAAEQALDRFRARMDPGACRYRHPQDGEVCAEFEMLLHRDQLWYRDRSLRLADGSVRGEIDGFSWLLFDRAEGAAELPALVGQQGVWRGRFRRYDAGGGLLETVASTVTIRVVEEAGHWRYHQTNLLGSEDAPLRRIEARGEIHSGRVWFASERYRGWAMDLPGEQPAAGSLLVMHPHDPADPEVHEIISCSPDGRRRWRVAQMLKEGRLVGRTAIDEERLTGD
ncbi:CpcT/CpeT family chromophore lyase [Cyanobium gracile UHCC 0139]|uniref:CpcT/CpeT family chromophore lyase n=1 Tax=Cyanobium gracile UHCC 0139 TaxID=3110308 RepID=A0ABU5RTK0_9CYAN|nr:CpcT/CpeT family chromophore lyase [Cyanobium gracile]MEA5391069.1 CpcT/CpeT family chromophore lyase [Cyanobium gracile UHCC 0139]